MIVVAVSLLVGGAVVLSVGRRMATDKLPPNGMAGLRTSATRRSEEAWYAGQRAAAPGTIGAGVTMLTGGVAMLPTGMEPGGVSLGLFVATLVVLAILMAMSVTAGQKAASET